MERYRGRLIAIAFITFSIMFSISTVGPLLSGLAEADSIPLGSEPNTTIGIIFSLGGLTLALSQMPFSALSDKHGRRVFIVAGSIVTGLAILGVGYSKAIASSLGWVCDPCLSPDGSTYLMALFRGVQGVGAAATWPIVMAVISAQVPEEKMGLAMGVFGASFGLGMALGPVVGPAIAAFMDIHMPFVFAFVLAVLSGVVAGLSIVEAKAAAHRKMEFPKDRRLYVLSLLVFALMYGMGGLVVIYPRYLTGSLGYTMKDLALALAVASLTYSFLQPVTGRMADKYDKRLLLLAGSILFIASTVVMAYGRSLTMVTASMLLFGVGGSLMFPASNSLVAIISPEGREGAYTGFYNMMLSMGVTVSPIFIGLVADLAGYTVGFLTTTILAVVAVSIFLAHKIP